MSYLCRNFVQASALVVGMVFSVTAYADFQFPLPPRFSANGYASDYTVGQADVMLPIKGDFAHNFYLDPGLGLGSDSQGYADIGVGYRWIQNAAAILGGYVFGGYSRLANNARVWVINPGIEVMGSRWDGHINAYFPMGDRNRAVNDYQAFGFNSGHSQFNNLFQLTQNDGVGADALVGYQLFPQTPVKAYLGSYVFAPSGGSVVGGAFAMEYWLQQHLKVFAAYSYDNVRHSTGALGLGVEFGGTRSHRSDPSLEERITDPIQRYIAELGQGSKIPTRNTSNQIAGPFSVLNNIAFFNQGGEPNTGGTDLTITNCTFENPCGPTDLTDAATNTLAGLLPNTTISLGGGEYAAVNVPNGTMAVTLQTGQSIIGNGSTLIGALNLSGDNNITGVVLLPNGSTATGAGITAGAGGNVSISGSQIGSINNPFTTGVSITESAQASITGCTIAAMGSGIVSSNSNLTVTGTGVTVAGAMPIGISVQGGGSLSVGAGSAITVDGTGNSVGVIQVTGSADIDLNGTDITVTSASGGALGVGSTAGGLGILGGSITVNGSNTMAGIGIAVAGSGGVSISGGTAVAVTGGDNTVGIRADSSGAVNIGSGTSITVTGGTATTGVSSNGSGPITIGTGTGITVTGGASSRGVYCSGSANADITGGIIHVGGGTGSAGLILDGSNGLIQLLDGTIVTVAGEANAVFGILANASATSNLIIDGVSKIAVTGGDLNAGILSFGSGTIHLLGGSIVTVNGGNDLVGIKLELGEAASLLVAGQSGVHVMGGDNSVGIAALGDGTVAVTEASLVKVIGGLNTIGIDATGAGAVQLTGGSQVQVTGGNGSIGINTETTGGLSLAGGSLVEVLGGLNTFGISAIGTGAVELTGASQVQVTGNAGSIGINTATTGGLSLAGGSLINVVGRAIGVGPIIGVNALNAGIVTGNQVTVNVSNTNSIGPAIGFATSNTATMNLDNVTVTVLGDGASAVKSALGGAITLSNCTAFVNGASQPCT